ncbi:MAG: acetyl-CoA carboxylase biotin carboxyl carrier protein [Treponema sp.]|jgi:acetyl-CoA carboxylase biotin carboxyl carrier protein|nr:acetyl-CoA carboxylase biotin carboxyl carrier protein [Treponema sp.]
MDEKLILTLIDKFSGGGLSELELCEGGATLVLRAAPAPLAAAACGEIKPGAAPGGETAPVALPASAAEKAAGAGGESITSPIVGTFYPAPSPDAPPFVRTRSRVKAGDTLCILEAMKMMNRLEAEFDCEILAVKASGGDMVEFGQELFEVRRLG